MKICARKALWFLFIASETAVLGVVALDFINSHRAAIRGLLMPAFAVGWPALLVTSLALFRYSRRAAAFGLVSCALGAFWYSLPVLIE